MTESTEAKAAKTSSRFSIKTQYIKDFSFENPNAPESMATSKEKPTLDLNIDVGAKELGGNSYETQLRITASKKRGNTTLFVIELIYCAVVIVENTPPERTTPLCLVEVPRIIFPFARRIIAETTHEGGFAPLLIDPVNFDLLYARKLKAAQSEKGILDND